MKNLFNDIIDTLSDNKPYPLENKYGLTYINDNEWIYFTIEEMNYQKYISDSKKMYSFLYDDYMNKVINEKEFFKRLFIGNFYVIGCKDKFKFSA